jgi:hypothetical protein
MLKALAILTLLKQQPACYIEIPDPTRDARLEIVATELAELPQSVALPLAYQGWKESRWCRYVFEGCFNIPKGAGANCDKGKARGYFQEHFNTCQTAYQFAPGTPESLHAEIQCAAGMWRASLQRCRGRHPAGDIAGAFGGFAGRIGCTWPQGAQRATEYDTTLAKFLRIKAQP